MKAWEEGKPLVTFIKVNKIVKNIIKMGVN